LTDILIELGFTNTEYRQYVETFSAGTYNVTLYAEFAGYHDENELSYYEVGTSVYAVIFTGPEGDGDGGYVVPPVNKSFTTDCEFGLSMLSPDYRYFSEKSRNPDGLRHAKVYENMDDPGMYLIGFENLYGWGGDRDFNDMIFSLKPYAPPVNDPPVAVNDAYSTTEDTMLSVSAPGVLGNDTDADLDSLTAVKKSDPSHGTLTLNSDGSFTYTPYLDFTGSDSFTYQAYDGQAYSNTATVTITVNPANDPPVAYDQSVTTAEDTPKAITLTASDPEDDPLIYSIVAGPSHGSLSGSPPDVTYTPYLDFTGSDSFTFKAYDSEYYSNIATVSITVVSGAPPPPPVGGYALPITLDLGASDSLIPQIGLASSLSAAVAATTILVRRRKKTLKREH